jgi:hypothetical protein
METSDQPKLILDLLMKKYALLREEIMFYARTAKLHTRYFQAFFAGTLIILWYLFFVAEASKFDAILQAIRLSRSDVVLFFLFATNITAFYFAFDILDCYYCVFLASARLQSIENQVNKELGSTLLIWESKFQLQDEIRFGTSRVAITIIQVIIVIFVACVFPLYCYWRLWIVAEHYQTFWITIAAVVCVLLSIAFIWSFFDVFFTKREQPLRIVNEILQGKR